MTDTPRRLTYGEIIALMLERGHGGGSSVTLTRNAKGETQIEVTVRAAHEQTVSDCQREATAVYDALRSRYPLASGYVDPRGENDE